MRRIYLLALAFTGLTWSQGPLAPLTILHTNDLHGHISPDDKGRGGFAYLATVIREQREHCAGCLVLNGGGLVQGTPVSSVFHGLPIYKIANRMGFDGAAIGNHDFDYGWQ